MKIARSQALYTIIAAQSSRENSGNLCIIYNCILDYREIADCISAFTCDNYA